MRTSRLMLLLAGVVLAGTRPARAQDSQFGIRGLGIPGRWESVRARTTGGAFAAFDAASALADAAMVESTVLTSTLVVAPSFRSVDTPFGDADLRATRFPLFTVSGTIGRWAVGGGFSTYLDNSYEVITRDSALVRGEMVSFVDDFASDGGVSDIRFAVARRIGPRLALGLGLHAMTGSARITAVRVFTDTGRYATVRDTQLVRQTGFGVSASALLTPSPRLSIIGYARGDDEFKTKLDRNEVGTIDLPNMFGGAVRLTLGQNARLAGSVTYRPWSISGPGAFNTLNWSAGLEVGSSVTAIRLGGRAGQLPFGPGTSPPAEWGVAAGLGRVFASRHGVMDVGIERLVRTGSGLEEVVWTVPIGFTIRQ